MKVKGSETMEISGSGKTEVGKAAPSGAKVLVAFGVTRTFSSMYGLLYIIIGMLIPLIPMFSIIVPLGNVQGISQIPIVSSLIPSMLPLFATIGASGVTYLFSTDRTNGVYEYLIATRKIKVSDIFVAYAIVDVMAVTAVLGVNLLTAYLLMALKAPSILPGFFTLVAIFSVPVAYSSSLISTLAMLTWSSLSKTYPGVNAPGGIGTLIGIVPPLGFLFLTVSSRVLTGNLNLMGGIFSGAMVAAFILMLILVTRLMSNERMLS